MQPDFVKVALNYTSKHVHIKSGRPQVLLSQQVTYAELNDLGLSVGNYGPTCTQPQQLVILRGDFDMRDAAPMSLAPSVVVPAAYIAYVYDIRTGDQVSIQWDRDGSHFKKALNDPSLPDLKALPSDSGNRDIPSTPVAPAAPAPVTPYLACTPQVAPGWATPPSTP